MCPQSLFTLRVPGGLYSVRGPDSESGVGLMDDNNRQKTVVPVDWDYIRCYRLSALQEWIYSPD